MWERSIFLKNRNFSKVDNKQNDTNCAFFITPDKQFLSHYKTKITEQKNLSAQYSKVYKNKIHI